MSTMPALYRLCLHYACTMSTMPVLCLLCLYYAYCACTMPVLCLLSMYYAYYACTMSTMLALCLYNACTMSTMLVLCLLCLYYASAMSTMPLCLFLCTMPIYNHRRSFTRTRCCYSQRWAKHFFRKFLKIVCGLVNQVTSHRFSLVNFALRCQYFLHRLWHYWLINHFYVSCK